jgi:quercetin dioxygenase-like cupin family protein
MNSYQYGLMGVKVLTTACLMILLSLSAAAADLPDALNAGWRGQKPCEKLFEDEKIRVARCTFPPGVGHERHFHPPHYLYVLGAGRVQVTDAKGTRDADVTPGVFRANPRIEWHEILNIGDTPLQYLVMEIK